MLPNRMVPWLTHCWRGLLHVCFFLLCVRFQGAAFKEVYPYYWPTLILAAGAFGLGCWRPIAALFAFTLAVPLLDGLAQTALLTCAFPPVLVFSALWMGISARKWWSKSEIDGVASIPLRSASSHFPARAPLLIADILITAMLFSLGYQLWRHRAVAGLWSAFSDRTVFGYGEQFYFLTSAFVWLQGLFYFRSLILLCDPRTLKAWIRPFFATLGTTMLAFVLIQFFSGIPAGWHLAGFQSPYEDISSFGSIAVALFIFAITIQRGPAWRMRALSIACSLGCLALVIASWSRAAWLAGILFGLIVSWYRFSRWATGLVIISTAFIVVFVNLNAERPSWTENIYLARLIQLVRFEKLSNKDTGRFNLYHKGLGMIAERPLSGHGIGSFYLSSVKYARKDDPNASTPDFGHNIFLQLAAELGVLVSALFAGLCCWSLWAGLQSWRKQHASGLTLSNQTLHILGVTLALGAYLETGMTGNSLNVYVSNQFFVWLLLAMLLCDAMLPTVNINSQPNA